MKQQVFEYNILGLDDSVSPTHHQLEVMKTIASAFADIQRAIEKEVDANLHQKVFGNLSKEETDKILQNYSTVQEGMKHIPGVLSDDKYQNHKMRIVNLILERLAALTEYGETQRVLKSDYKKIKTALLQKLFQQFGSHLDMELFRSTMPKLKEMNLIPNNLTVEELAHLCPIGHWF